MKLLSKTNRYYFFYTALLLACGGIIFYFIISNIIKAEVGEILKFELSDYVHKAEKDSSWLTFQKTLEFEISPSNSMHTADFVSDTLMQEAGDDEIIPYLQLKVVREINGQNYQIIMRESLIESEGILFGVAVSMTILFVALLLGLFLLNNYLSKVLWKPFYLNLTKVKNYHLSHVATIEKVDSDIQEFQELNQALVKMTERIRKDYVSLKEFTENASHEIQTPLAIIKSNIDWLLQHIRDEEQLSDLSKIEMAANRISKTNHALLLLTKIENHHFTEVESLHFGAMITQILADFEDFISAKNLIVNYKNSYLHEDRLFNKTLVQVLLNNLINNAIRHNIQNGFINIILSEQQLTIENSGNAITVDPSKLFERFAKANQSAESIGLGLSIIKKICDELGLQVVYHYQATIHTISIYFQTPFNNN